MTFGEKARKSKQCNNISPHPFPCTFLSKHSIVLLGKRKRSIYYINLVLKKNQEIQLDDNGLLYE